MYCLWFAVSILMSNVICDEKVDGKAPRIQLNDGTSIPALGLGTFLGFDEHGQKKVNEGDVEIPVSWAFEVGYRLIDTASAYQNEEQIGLAVRKAAAPRESIYVVTKVASHEQRDVVAALHRSLHRLNLTYVDLYLIHTPVTFKEDHSGYDIIDYLDTWRSMEKAQKLGLTKSIGISNFNISQIERIMANCEIKPAVLQVEVNLNLAQTKLVDYCKANGIVLMAYTPFGSLFESGAELPPPRADDPALVAIANKYDKTTPQIALRYLVQRGIIPIPKSVNKNRIQQNIDVFDFELTSEEMEILSKFNKDYRTVSTSFWQDHPYYPYEQKDVPDPSPFDPKKE